MDQVFAELQRLSRKEKECYEAIMEHRVSFSPEVAAVVIGNESMEEIASRFDRDTIVSVARYTADVLAEASGKLSLIAYPEERNGELLIQFRLRRSQHFKEFDVRTVLEAYSIENGGGHPGAIGFRIPRAQISDLTEYCRELINGVEKLLSQGA
jgi:nanoRNase/pAp phosphatase (c-di-AMP/oligoRNAs hydrolase)